jgi:hypothetical protein
VLQIAVCPLKIRLDLGDLIFIVRPLGLQLVATLLHLANRKGVLFKLLFETRTPFLGRFDRLL